MRRITDNAVETVAGTGELGDAKDGPALYAQFNHPTNVSFDAQGRMLIAAWHNSLVKRLDLATGLVENVAGTGARSYGGDNGPANAAALNLPSAVVVDKAGNIIFSDQANFRLRVVDASGTIRTMCGKGTPGYSGDGGPALAAELKSPVGQSAAPAGRIAIDKDDRIYIADTGNHAVRRIDTDGTITTLAGTGQPGYSGDEGPATAAELDTPSDVAVARNGTVYIADTMNNAVRMVRPDGTITTLAGTGDRGFSGDRGPAAQAKLDRPYGVEVALNDSVYVADTHNHRIRLVSDSRGDAAPDARSHTDTAAHPVHRSGREHLHLRRHRAAGLQRRRPRSACTRRSTGRSTSSSPPPAADRARLEQPQSPRNPHGRHADDHRGHRLRRRRARGSQRSHPEPARIPSPST